jgi:hypothetical protein
VRIESTSDNDLFFHYTHSMDEAGFLRMQEEQQLTIHMGDYLPVLARTLNACIASPDSHLGLFVLRAGGQARLDFYQNVQYKFIELLSVSFVESDEETIRRSITHRCSARAAHDHLLLVAFPITCASSCKVAGLCGSGGPPRE